MTDRFRSVFGNFFYILLWLIFAGYVDLIPAAWDDHFYRCLCGERSRPPANWLEYRLSDIIDPFALAGYGDIVAWLGIVHLRVLE